jgi:rSAM/selenodomain-associated transferase 1
VVETGTAHVVEEPKQAIMNECALGIFVKTPGYTPVKTRLATSIGEENTRELYHLFIHTCRELVSDLPDTCTPHWCVTEPEAMHHWQDMHACCSLPEKPDAADLKLGHRLAHCYNTLGKHFTQRILTGSDCPEITPDHIKETLQWLQSGGNRAVIGPARDGGFYLFGSNAKIPDSCWINVEYSQPDTLEQLQHNLQPLGLETILLEPLQDVDTLEDLEQLAIRLGRPGTGQPMPSSLSAIKTLCEQILTEKSG